MKDFIMGLAVGIAAGAAMATDPRAKEAASKLKRKLASCACDANKAETGDFSRDGDGCECGKECDCADEV